jgi:hypothetical protein
MLLWSLPWRIKSVDCNYRSSNLKTNGKYFVSDEKYKHWIFELRSKIVGKREESQGITCSSIWLSVNNRSESIFR